MKVSLFHCSASPFLQDLNLSLTVCPYELQYPFLLPTCIYNQFLGEVPKGPTPQQSVFSVCPSIRPSVRPSVNRIC